MATSRRRRRALDCVMQEGKGRAESLRARATRACRRRRPRNTSQHDDRNAVTTRRSPEVKRPSLRRNVGTAAPETRSRAEAAQEKVRWGRWRRSHVSFGAGPESAAGALQLVAMSGDPAATPGRLLCRQPSVPEEPHSATAVAPAGQPQQAHNAAGVAVLMVLDDESDVVIKGFVQPPALLAPTVVENEPLYNTSNYKQRQ